MGRQPVGSLPILLGSQQVLDAKAKKEATTNEASLPTLLGSQRVAKKEATTNEVVLSLPKEHFCVARSEEHCSIAWFKTKSKGRKECMELTKALFAAEFLCSDVETPTATPTAAKAKAEEESATNPAKTPAADENQKKSEEKEEEEKEEGAEAKEETATNISGDDEKSRAKKEQPHGSQTARSVKSMDEETWKAEKNRLHSMVRSFSQEAVVGLSCKVLEKVDGTEDWREQWRAKFSLDRALTTATIDYSGRKLIFSLSDVEDVYAYEDLMDELPDPKNDQWVTKEDRHKTVFVRHRVQSLPEPWICLLLNDEADADRFASSLKILKMYTHSKAKATPVSLD